MSEQSPADDGDLADRIQDRMMRGQAGDQGEDDGVPRSASGAPAGGRAVEDLFSADEVFQRLTATADHEFRRSPRMLWFSGMAAGFSIGTTFLSRAALGAETGDPGQMPADLLYPVGFILIVLGRYQLFTENTLTPVTLVMSRIASLPALLRLWGVVFAANILGAALIAGLLSIPGTLDPEIIKAGDELAKESFETSLIDLFLKAIIAGAIVASMVWLMHAVRDGTTRFLIIYILMIMIPVGGLVHVITGFCEVFFGFVHGVGGPFEVLGFLLAVGLGNTVGGVMLVAMINYGQTRESRLDGRNSNALQLSWREFFLGYHRGRDRGGAVAPELERTSDGGVSPPPDTS